MDVTSYKPPLTIQNQQNNFIQVNGLMITQKQIKNLPADKLKKIQEMMANLTAGRIKKLSSRRSGTTGKRAINDGHLRNCAT